MHLIQAIYMLDIEAVHGHMARGYHPGRFLEHCVTARHRPDLLPFILGFMSVGNAEELACIVRLKRHLQFVERYPLALSQINEWLSAKSQLE